MSMSPRLLRPTAGFLPLRVDWLVVAGGGGGGSSRGGGGGAGGVLQGTAFAATAGSNYTVTVGGGGAGSTSIGAAGGAGTASVFGTNSATGGGGGGTFSVNGQNGGSGGGSGASTSSRPGGTGVTGQGNKGGDNNTSFAFAAGGGGGAGAAGANVTVNQATDGGIGILSSITGTPTYYAGGGGGSGGDGSTTFAGKGGLGGGGNGSDFGQSTGTAPFGTANTGGGGGGAATPGGSSVPGGNGGSGVVILRYPRRYTPTISSSLTYDTSDIGPWRILRFTAGSGFVAWNAPQVSNADAQDWINRVYANGGAVTSSTASAVNSLCVDLENAGLRDRFYRLNLFCGTGLNACLVPLYRGPSLGGTQYGNITDTNVGPFVSGDYVETGASGGLLGNGTSKYLNTGLNANSIGTEGHAAIYHRASIANAGASMLGVSDGASHIFGLDYSTGVSNMRGFWGSTATAAFGSTSGGLHAVTRRSATDLEYYRNGGSVGTQTTSVTPTAPAQPFFVFASNQNGTPGIYSAANLQAYSLGLSMTAAQAAAYYTAMQAFQTALGRNV